MTPFATRRPLGQRAHHYHDRRSGAGLHVHPDRHRRADELQHAAVAQRLPVRQLDAGQLEQPLRAGRACATRSCAASQIGLLATIGATFLGTLMAFALVRHPFAGRSAANVIIFLPMASPEIVMGSSLLALFVAAGFGGQLGFWTILIAHIMFCLSFVVVTVKARLTGMDSRLEQAAMDLYANEWQTFWRVTFPLVFPGILGAALLAFSLSFDDFIITNLNAGTTTTFPMFVWSSAQRQIPMQINVVGTVMFVISVGIVVERRAQPPPYRTQTRRRLTHPPHPSPRTCTLGHANLHSRTREPALSDTRTCTPRLGGCGEWRRRASGLWIAGARLALTRQRCVGDPRPTTSAQPLHPTPGACWWNVGVATAVSHPARSGNSHLARCLSRSARARDARVTLPGGRTRHTQRGGGLRSYGCVDPRGRHIGVLGTHTTPPCGGGVAARGSTPAAVGPVGGGT